LYSDVSIIESLTESIQTGHTENPTLQYHYWLYAPFATEKKMWRQNAFAICIQ